MNVTPCAVAGPLPMGHRPRDQHPGRRRAPTAAGRRAPRRSRRGPPAGTGSDSCPARCRWPTRRRRPVPARVIPGSAGTCDDDPTPGSRSGRWVAAAPAAHSASRRVIPKQPSAPAVASASVCGTRQLHPRRQVQQRSERAVGLSLLDDLFGQLVADVADAAQTQPHLGAGVLQRGVRQAGVDVRAVHGHPVPAGVGHQRLRRVEAHRLRPQQRRAERRGVVQLEPRRVEHQRGEATANGSPGSRNWRTPPASRRSGRPPRR